MTFFWSWHRVITLRKRLKKLRGGSGDYFIQKLYVCLCFSVIGINILLLEQKKKNK